MAFERVTLSVAGIELLPVTIQVSVAMDNAARDFSAKLKDPRILQPALVEMMKGGPEIRIYASGSLMLTGHVEKVSPSIRSDEAELVISGRSKTGDAIDSGVDHDKGEFRKKSAKNVFDELAGKYGVSVVDDAQLKTRDLFRIRPGETVFAAAERWARAEGFSISDTEDGKLRFFKDPKKRHVGGIVEGLHFKDASANFDLSKRFKTTKVRAQAPDGYSADDLEIESEATDDGLARQRTRIVIPPELIKKADARERAKWHRDRAAGQGTTAEVTTIGWRDSAGVLWTAGHLVDSQAPSLGLSQEMMIERVAFNQSNDATEASVGMVDPRAYGGKKGKGGKSNAQWDLGKAGGDDE